MKKDNHKTPVKFVYHEQHDDLFAVFTEDKRTGTDGLKLFNSYAHIGQHSDASEGYIKECRLATPEEYKDLATELESIGYNLEILNKQS